MRQQVANVSGILGRETIVEIENTSLSIVTLLVFVDLLRLMEQELERLLDRLAVGMVQCRGLEQVLGRHKERSVSQVRARNSISISISIAYAEKENVAR